MLLLLTINVVWWYSCCNLLLLIQIAKTSMDQHLSIASYCSNECDFRFHTFQFFSAILSVLAASVLKHANLIKSDEVIACNRGNTRGLHCVLIVNTCSTSDKHSMLQEYKVLMMQYACYYQRPSVGVQIVPDKHRWMSLVIRWHSYCIESWSFTTFEITFGPTKFR